MPKPRIKTPEHDKFVQAFPRIALHLRVAGHSRRLRWIETLKTVSIQHVVTPPRLVFSGDILELITALVPELSVEDWRVELQEAIGRRQTRASQRIIISATVGKDPLQLAKDEVALRYWKRKGCPHFSLIHLLGIEWGSGAVVRRSLNGDERPFPARVLGVRRVVKSDGRVGLEVTCPPA